MIRDSALGACWDRPPQGKEQFVAHLASPTTKMGVQHLMSLDGGVQYIYHTSKFCFNQSLEWCERHSVRPGARGLCSRCGVLLEPLCLSGHVIHQTDSADCIHR